MKHPPALLGPTDEFHLPLTSTILGLGDDPEQAEKKLIRQLA